MTQWLFPFTPDSSSPRLAWADLLARFEWLRALAGCPQDPFYHAEGDVLIHTEMVVQALINDPTWPSLNPVARSVLFAAALLHDVAKPLCTQIENGRITSPDHARKGARLTQRLLYHKWPLAEPPAPFDQRQQIVSLVRYHGLPRWFLDREPPEQTIIETSLKTRNDYLALLARADMLGRRSADQPALLDEIDLFTLFCEEKGCLDRPWPFPSDHSRFLYFRRPGRDPHYEAYDDTRLEVVLMAGLPGAGKDSWVRQNLPDWPVVSLDTLRGQLNIDPEENQGAVLAAAKDQARIYLRQGQNFVWNATNISRSIRRRLIDFFSDYQARVRIVYVETPWAELLQRNQARPSPVPEPVLQRLANRLEAPDLTEAQQVEWNF